MLHSNSLEGLFQSPCCSQAGHWRRDAAAGRLGQRRGGRWRLAGRGGALVEGAQVDGARHQPVLAVVRVLAPSVEDHPSGGERECGGGDVFQAATGGHLDLQSFLLFAANAQPTLRHNCFSAAPSGRQSYYVLPSSPIRPV